MNDHRLRILLDAGAQRWLTDAEETELSRLLEDPANREVLDRELGPLKHRFGALLDYHRARQAVEPKIPPARLEALLTGMTDRMAPSAPKVVPFRRWFGPVMAAAAIAACLTVVVWYQRPGPQSRTGGELAIPSAPTSVPGVATAPRTRGTFEFAVVATIASVRGAAEKTGSTLGPDWRVVPQENLASLRAWSTASLPASVTARVWVDEEAGKLRAMYRLADGTVAGICRATDGRQVDSTETVVGWYGSLSKGQGLQALPLREWQRWVNEFMTKAEQRMPAKRTGGVIAE
ncbi:MAG: hypothetical protein IPN11_10935 [Opitutaceae bacterium]|nr:hypothetical protein [Opitutaceae bacterium]